MTKKRVRIIPGCISCGTCEAICPQVFEVKGTARVHDQDAVADYEDEVEEAAEMCPVSVIKVDDVDDE